MQDTLEGFVKNIIFRNEENGYSVLSLEHKGTEITCTGYFEALRVGETVALFGHYTEHAVYGQQFKADGYEIRIPEDAAAIERYLASGAVKGIGEALAHRIVLMFGDDSFRIMEEEPERLAEVKGISLRMAQEIGAKVEEQTEMRRAMMFLTEYGISLAVGIRIYKEYGQEMYRILRENPYRLAEDIDGIGFKTADEIAGRIGIRADSSFRIGCGILYVLQTAASEGSCYLPSDLLLSRTALLLGVEEEQAVEEIANLAIDRKIVLAKEPGGGMSRIYHSRYYRLEAETARFLTDRNGIVDVEDKKIERLLSKLAETSEVKLEEEQAEAVRAAAKYGLVILTGGPGTGKTTAIHEILRYFEAKGASVALAAPTGRAARRMTEATGYEASTIHRLLEIGPIKMEGGNEQFRFTRNAENPLEQDVFIIDEMSMVDIFLMHALLAAIPPGARLILVGDEDQLPSVGAGNVLHDLIASGRFPTIRLTRIFRQGATSDIVVSAHKINEGEMPLLTNKSRDFFFLKRDDANRTIHNMIELIRDKLPSYVDADRSEIQVLTPMRKGALGVERLNRILQKYLNPPSPEKKEKEYGEDVFRMGDKVMQIKNDYQLSWHIPGKYGIPVEEGTGVFNGDIGVIEDINPAAGYLTVRFEEGRRVDYEFAQLSELELSYAVTIHKAQGSEYPAVILPLLGGPAMLFTRKLLYTAVTRARKTVVILGKEDVLKGMVGNLSEAVRYTSLTDRIREFSALGEGEDL